MGSVLPMPPELKGDALADIGLDNTLPSEASIDLPRVYILAEYMQDESVSIEPKKAADGSMYSKGNYFKSKAEIGELDHCLTTDMLNHLVFVQKVFMKEVNEVVQKMAGKDLSESVKLSSRYISQKASAFS